MRSGTLARTKDAGIQESAEHRGVTSRAIPNEGILRVILLAEIALEGPIGLQQFPKIADT